MDKTDAAAICYWGVLVCVLVALTGATGARAIAALMLLGGFAIGVEMLLLADKCEHRAAVAATGLFLAGTGAGGFLGLLAGGWFA